MSAKEILNKPVTFELCGKKRKFRRLSAMEILSIAEDYIIDNKIKKIKATADLIEDVDNQIEFISKKTDELPEGIELESLAKKIIDTGDSMPDAVAFGMLFASMKDFDESLLFDDAVNLFSDSPTEVTIPIYRVIAGKKANVQDRPSSKSSRKRTAGRRK